MRQLRRMLETGLPIVGVVVIVSAVFLVSEIRAQVGIVMLGIFLIEAGVWKLANQLLPSQRTFHAMRLEGDRFIGLIRQLNATALALKAYDSPANRQTFAEVREAMLQAVERMAHVAGKTDDELTDAPTVAPSTSPDTELVVAREEGAAVAVERQKGYGAEKVCEL